jgi:YD repeat-containing protein
MAAGDKWLDCSGQKNISLDQAIRKMIYRDAEGNPVLHTDPAGTALEPYFTCDNTGESTEQVLRALILQDADGNPYLNTTSS